jgi:CHAP domain
VVGRAATAARPLFNGPTRRRPPRLSSSGLNRHAWLPITAVMSIEGTLERVSAIRQALADPAAMIGSRGAMTGGTGAPSAPGANGEASFASALKQASSGYQAASPGAFAPVSAAFEDPSTSTTGLAGATVPTSSYQLQGLAGIAGSSLPSSATGPGSQMVAIAESQLGQAEQPPGSNESPAIAQYRGATAGAAPGAPWCAYFASWVARQAGEPLGEQGQGLGSVSEVWSWAQSNGRAVANGPGVVPKPGDLIVFGGEHVGIVRDVLPGGQIQTIEGNYENKVAANVRSPSEATGYVTMS